MSRYRRVATRMWGDEKFRQLSAPPPNAQTLWLYLLTGPHTGPIPGLACAGEAGLAEALGWELEAFRKAFAEVAALGMAEADWPARVVYLPRAIHHNEPESPNVVTMWRRALEEIPDSPLKERAASAITDHLRARGAAWLEAWTDKRSTKASGKPSGKPSEKPSRKGVRTPFGESIAVAVTGSVTGIGERQNNYVGASRRPASGEGVLGAAGSVARVHLLPGLAETNGDGPLDTRSDATRAPASLPQPTPPAVPALSANRADTQGAAPPEPPTSGEAPSPSGPRSWSPGEEAAAGVAPADGPVRRARPRRGTTSGPAVAVAALNGSAPWPSVEALVQDWNEYAAPECPRVDTITQGRRQAAEQRLAQFPDRDLWRRAFRETRRSKFLRGLKPSAEHRNWRATFDWALAGKDGVETLVKLAEGHFRDRGREEA